MSLTKITWEEFDTFEKIESPKGYDFRTHEGKYYTFGEFGVASLIDVPKNRKLFSKEELEELIPIAEKLWIESEGELPDYYVSPLK